MADLTIIVPVMKRPQNATRFMRSLRRTDAWPCRVMAVVDEDDEATIQAWWEENAVMLVSAYGPTFPNKAQYAYEMMGSTEWIFLCGDDVTFTDGWWREAMKVASMEPDACLIAINDTHNPFVTAGVHATHPLIKRSWVEKSGASWDGPGVLVHQGYFHSYCDNEWTEKARMEGVFAPALASIVEHRHYSWGGAPFDPIYELPIEHLHADGQLYEERKRSAERLRRFQG